MPPNIMCLIKLKREARKFYKKYKSARNRKTFYRLAKTLKSSIMAFRNAREEKILLNGSIKQFFAYTRSRMCTISKIGPINNSCGHQVTDDSDKAEAFNDFFHSVYKHDDGTIPIFNKRTESIMPTPVLFVDEVRRVLMESKSSYACGPDGSQPIFLKKFPELCSPLCILFNMSIQQGRTPMAWKVATIIPIFKGKGSSLDTKNYRPISLTNVYYKTLEKLLREKLLSYLESENLLSSAQSGFRPGLSTLTQLTSAQSFINNNINELRCVDGVYTDLSKAFDTISHRKLLLKLNAYGIQGPLLEWIRSFLTDRYQSVSINSVLSSLKPCTSGTPQGSVLSPLLFLLYINDMPECIKQSTVFHSADDAKLLTPITCLLDCLLFQ